MIPLIKTATWEAHLQQLYEDNYLPVMSCALVLTQSPPNAICAVRDVLTLSAYHPEQLWIPGRLYNELLKVTPVSHDPTYFSQLYSLPDDTEAEKIRDTKLKMLSWLSVNGSDAKILAILAQWLGYSPEDSDSEEILSEMAMLIGHDTTYTKTTWKKQRDLWQARFKDSNITLFDALQLWLECLPLSQEEQYRKCLKFGRMREYDYCHAI
jgi:hypothetical protein